MKTWKCYRCTMTFRVGEPQYPKLKDYVTRCQCGQRFWNVGAQGPAPAIVGIFPEDDPRGAGYDET